MKIPFFRLSECDEEKQLVNEVLDSGWLTTGKFARELEQRFADYCQTKHAIAVNSCTSGLHLAAEALSIGVNDKVAVPTMTFTATAEVVRYLGADLVLMDVNPKTLLVEPETVKDTIERTPDIKAVMVVHMAGQPAIMAGENGIQTLCNNAGIPVIQDAAHAFPCWDKYGPIGSFGDITVFSFYANKTMTTGEGGMVVTNDEAAATRMQKMRLHGIDRDVFDRFSGKRADAWIYDVVAPGFKYNLPDVNAAIGVAQFDKAFEFRDARERIAKQYESAFADIATVEYLESRVAAERHAWHLFPIMVTDKSVVDRTELIHKLNELGVGTSVHYRPIHQLSYYKNRYDLRAEDFPGAEHYWNRCVSLPIYPAMTAKQVDYVIECVLKTTGAV